ncbi:hypothetical protein [Halorubellus sp. PRR65]|uniref:hypothetical protein n=1 Tax=Halorubellus sp. PRR65 TaxID=3098148 RepID=UPI002B263459|nr:hypothetical protein [Halorubellus sp. PRR65]
MDGNDSVEDRHAAALLGDSQYERIKLQRYSLFKQSLPRTLALQGLILAALALVLPLALSQPEPTRALLGGDVLAAEPKFLFLGAYAGAIEFVGVVGCCYVAYRRLATDDGLSEREVHDLLAIEDAATHVSLVTGGAAVAVVHGFFLVGLAGDPFVGRFQTFVGRNPFEPGLIPVSVTGVAAAATVLAVLALGLSYLLRGRLAY